MRFVFVCLAFVLLAGCIDTSKPSDYDVAKGPLFTELGEPRPVRAGTGRIYFYRLLQFEASALDAKILDNDVLVGQLRVGGYLTYDLEPGLHKIHTDTIAVDEPDTLDVKEGWTYYVRIRQEGFWRSVLYSEQMNTEDALYDLQKMRYQGY